jgi:S1-C subfamily serine protease
MLDTTKGELKVAGFATGSGAEAAGVKKGDIILAVDDQKVKDIDDLKVLLAAKHVGDRVRVEVRRDDATLELKVELVAPVRHVR